MKYIIAIACLIVSTVCAATLPTTINDTFADAANWAMNDKWHVTEDGKMNGSSKDRIFLELKDKIDSSNLTFEADITPMEANSVNWKTSGIAIYKDAKNYWALNLAERPDANDKSHYIEMREMRDGKWGADQDDAKPLLRKGGINWQYNTTYHLKLTLTPTDITGSLTDDKGKIAAEFKFQLLDTAVKSGSPALRISSMTCNYDQAVIEAK
jgi:hypothetical protein